MLANDKDKPAAPNTGKVLPRRFRFEVCVAWDMWRSSDWLNGTPFGLRCVLFQDILSRPLLLNTR